MKKRLKWIFAMQLLVFLVCSIISAQETTIKGKVTMLDGELIQGAIVVGKGISFGAVADVGSQFAIQVPAISKILVLLE